MNEVTQSSRIIGVVSAFVTGFYSCPLLSKCVFSLILFLCGYVLPNNRHKMACHSCFKNGSKNGKCVLDNIATSIPNLENDSESTFLIVFSHNF